MSESLLDNSNTLNQTTAQGEELKVAPAQEVGHNNIATPEQPSSTQESLSREEGHPDTEVLPIGQAVNQKPFQQEGDPSQAANQQTDLNWNFDGMEDKNPFSGFSEEHLNKLDEVLSSAGVQALLQQSSPDLGLLNLDGTEQLPVSTTGDGHISHDDSTPSTSARRDSSDSLPESIIAAVFSDHGYCMNPEKAQKPKAATTPPVVKTMPVLVGTEPSGEVLPLNDFPTALSMPSDSDTDQADLRADPESPSSSQRKSGRAPGRKRYQEEDWVTQGSPGKGRGRGRGSPGLPSPFGFRASTRISDQKQRDLAEKIMLANRQAMEAEKLKDETEDTDRSSSKSPEKTKGQGKTKAGSGKKGGKSSQDEDDMDESQDDVKSSDEENVTVEESDLESEPEVDDNKKKKKDKKKGKSGKKKKKRGGKYEEDSDYSESEDKKDKKKAKDKKGKVKKDDGVEETEEKVKKGKKGKLAKVKKKGKFKGKKGKKKGEKSDKKSEKEDSDISDKEEEKEEKKTEKGKKEAPPKKSPKKLTKKERLKKLKEAKEAKKKKLLEKLKEKKKEKKEGKMSEMETEDSETSPKKKGKAAVGKVGSTKKKADTEDESAGASPKKKTKVGGVKSPKAAEKRKASPARAAKGLVTVPAKKQKRGKQSLAKSKEEVSDSDSDESQDVGSMDKTKEETKSSVSEGGPITSPSRTDQNIFASFTVGLGVKSKEQTEIKLGKDLVDVKCETNTDNIVESLGEGKTGEIGGLEVGSSENKENKTDIQVDKDKHDLNIDNEDVDVVSNEHELENSDLADTLKNIEKDADTKTHHHHHHHHRHSQDKKESDDKVDSVKSHKHESRDRRESGNHRHSLDRRDSVTQEKDRRSSKGSRDKEKDRRKSSDSKERDRRDSARDSVDSRDKDRKDSSKDKKDPVTKGKDLDKKMEGAKDRRDSVGSVEKGETPGKQGLLKKGGKTNKDGKGKVKKVKKFDEPIDSSMSDLFMPDNLPSKEEAVQRKVLERTKLTAKKDENIAKGKVSNADSLKRKSVDSIENSGKDNVAATENKTDVDLLDIKEERKVDDKEARQNSNKAKPEISVEPIQLQEAIKSDAVIHNIGKAEKIIVQEVECVKVDDSAAGEIAMEVEQVLIKSESEQNKPLEGTALDVSEKVSELQAKLKAEAVGVVKDSVEIKESLHKADGTSIQESDEKEVALTATKIVVEEPEHLENIAEMKETTETKKPKVNNPLKMSDFFSERRLKINDPKPRQKVMKIETATVDNGDLEPSSGRTKRNKAKNFAEILKKEKLGSDDEEESDSDYEDDENDEDFEDPDTLYCICRQPHNQRFMICCDKCEEWFHGKCVGISRARGAEMEKNNEEYVCPQCKDADSGAVTGPAGAADIQDGKVASTTQSPEQTSKKLQTTLVKHSKTTAEEIKPDSTVDKEGLPKTDVDVPKPSTSKETGEATPKAQKPVKKTVQSGKSKQGESTPKGKAEPESNVKVKTSKEKATQKLNEKSREKGPVKRKSREDLIEKRKRMMQMVKGENEAKTEIKDKQRVPHKCLGCQSKPPRKDSLYCSDECKAKHSKQKANPEVVKHSKLKEKNKKKNEKHVAVVEKSTGRTLTGEKAPTEKELKKWLEENPTFEVLKAHHLPRTPSTDGKGDNKDSGRSDSSKSDKSEGPEPVRLNVRKGLRDALAARAESADDIMLSSSEIKSIALSIEEELFKYFKDTDHKYKAKYRSLIFNIKDQKNKGLFRKILSGRVRPSKLIRMSPEDLASKELAQWREFETKHTLEMIKQTEKELQKEPIHMMKKTHKGEEEVTDPDKEDLSTLANAPKKEEQPRVEGKEVEEGTEAVPDTTDMHGHHLFDANCKICTGKLVPHTESTPTKTTVVTTESTSGTEEKDLTKKERDLQADEVVKEVLKAIQRAKEDERKEELEAQHRSSVTVRSPDSALSSGLEKNSKFTPIGPMLWKGFIYMQDVSKFVTTAYRVTGSVMSLVLPDTITLCGRISPEHVWDYLNKVKHSATRDICVIRFIPGANEEKAAYINLYSYLNSRSRCGVVEHKSKNIKDFYIVPLASHSKIPDVLLPFDGPGLEENRCHMLLGVIIRNKVKSGASLDFPSASHSRHSHHSRPLKSALKDPFEPESPDKSSHSSSSSSTPQMTSVPLASTSEKKRVISFDPIVKEYSHISEQEETYEPGGDDPLDLNAPYDPEKEALKEPAKPKKEKTSDAISKMIEKIAQSKNPAEATAAMVAALATSSKLGNQRKLLLELTKKVDEQKRLLEQKRISARAGQSPSISSPGVSGAAVSSTVSNIGISAKDPRLRSQNPATAAAAAAANASDNSNLTDDSELMDLDLRVQPGIAPATSIISAQVQVEPVKPAPVLPPTLSPTALEKSVSILSSLTSEIASNASGSSVKTSETVSVKHASKTEPFSMTIKSQNQTISVPSVFSDSAESKYTLSGLDGKQETVAKPKAFYVEHDESKADESISAKNDSQQGIVESKLIKLGDNKGTYSSVDKSEKASTTAKLPPHEIVTQLMAEVSGKVSAEPKSGKPSTDVKSSEIQEEPETDKSDKSETGSKTSAKPGIPNVTALLKGLVSKDGGESGKKGGIQLPSALMSLFSKLPGSADEPPEAEPAKIPGLFSDDTVETAANDSDLRENAKVEEKSKKKSSERSREIEAKDEKLSKSFLGFDYDSDSSGGSFEGFDDDGTKKLSPRKRKLVQKSPRALEAMINSPRTNLFGDVDERGTPPQEDEDLRGDDVDLRQGSEIVSSDIDRRMPLPLSLSMTGQPLPPGEEPLPHVIIPPPGLRVPFVPTSSQPPPPGMEWEHPLPVSVAMGIPGLAPHPAEWAQARPPEVSQPPLPAEPPKPKPPEPPMKKKKAEDESNRGLDDWSDDDSRGQSRNSKKKKKKKAKKDKKGGPVTSDERLKKIVLEIAKKEPIEPPPMPPVIASGVGQMPYIPPQPMMPMAATMGPEVSGVMPVMSSVQGPIMGSSGWMDNGNMVQGTNSISQMVPPMQPPHMQPGVAPPMPSGLDFGPRPPGLGPRPPGPGMPQNMGFPGRGGPMPGPRPTDFGKKPPSIFDLPTLPPTSKLLAKNLDLGQGSGLGPSSVSPNIMDSTGSRGDTGFSESEGHHYMHPDQEGHDASNNDGGEDRDDQSRDRDRDRRDRHHRSRSDDRKHRSRSRSYRSRSKDRDSAEYHHRDRSRDRSHHHHRDRSRDRDRDRRHRNRR